MLEYAKEKGKFDEEVNQDGKNMPMAQGEMLTSGSHYRGLEHWDGAIYGMTLTQRLWVVAVFGHHDKS